MTPPLDKMHDAPIGLATLIGIYFVGIKDSDAHSYLSLDYMEPSLSFQGGVIGEPWFPISRDQFEISRMVPYKAQVSNVSAFLFSSLESRILISRD